MKINENVHLIRKDFYVTEDIKRYVNIYLITGKYCYLIDSGVSGSETLIAEYLESIGRKMTEIKGVFLTHAHPDHIGAAAKIKRQTGCQIFAPLLGLSWIENIQVQFGERPIPNFFKLLSESVKVDYSLLGGEVIELEEGITITSLFTPGHSQDSMSYIFNDRTIFTGDAIPAPDDFPIFVNFKECITSIDKIRNMDGIVEYCPAWDKVYNRDEFCEVSLKGRKMLCKLKETVEKVDTNPLFMKSIEACRKNVD